MPRTIQDLEKVTIRLFRGDKEKLEHFFPVGYNKVIRYMIRNLLKGIEERTQQSALPTEFNPAIDINSVLEEAESE